MSGAAAAGPAPDETLSVEAALALVRATGGRVTAARRLLIEVLHDQGAAHLSAEALTERVQSTLPDVHVSTVYRNLEELEHLGVVSHTHVGHGPAVYHLVSREHGHLVCSSCGTTLEVSTSMFQALTDDALERHGFVVDPGHSAVLGTCRNCVASRS